MIGLLKGPAANFSEAEKRDGLAEITSLLVRSGDLDAAKPFWISPTTAKDEVQYWLECGD